MSAYYENGKWGFINTEGEVAIQPDFDEVEDFSDDLAIVKKDGKWGVVNKIGKYVHDCEYDSISAFDSGIAYAMKGAIPFYLYESGKKVQLTRSSYRYMPFSNGMARIQNIKTGRWGYTDAKGEVVISPDYSVASDFNNGHAVVERKGKSYIINKNGDIKPAPFRFDEKVTFFDNGTGYSVGEDDKLKCFDRGLNVTCGISGCVLP